MMFVRTRPVLLIAALAVVTTLFAFDAMAQEGAQELLLNVGDNVKGIPKVIALMSYIVGTFFAVSGLLKLKDWINEGDKAGLNPALFRLVLSALLILLPYMIGLSSSVFYGRNDNNGWDTAEGLAKGGSMNAFQRVGK